MPSKKDPQEQAENDTVAPAPAETVNPSVDVEASGTDDQGGRTRVVYRGPSGALIIGDQVAEAHGDPVVIDVAELEHLRSVLPEHTFEQI